MIETLGWLTWTMATGSTLLFLCNLIGFRRTRSTASRTVVPAASVLIPARNEADQIAQTVKAVLASKEVDLEVLVLDDQSQDATASIVAEIAETDSRVRLVHGSSLPRGWCGKQYACHQLAQQAGHAELVFMDADVVLRPDAIRRCILQRRATGADLLSGFPQQVVGSLGEGLLIPMIYIVLLTYLPFLLMRKTRLAAASAGCGQLFVTDRQAYLTSGGHAAIRSSMHDGITLPRAYRRAGLRTDLVDAADVATCRMYCGWQQTCSGLLKNAHEGLASHCLIVPFTLLLGLGYVAPTALALYQWWVADQSWSLAAAAGAALTSYVPRLVTAWRYDRSWYAVPWFPAGVLLFVALQWIAWARHLSGTRSHWRGRAYAHTIP